MRLIHRDSGARGEGRETRSVTQNRKAAFLHLVNTPTFKNWHRVEVARRLGKTIPETPEQIKERVNKMVDEAMKTGQIVVEEFEVEAGVVE